MAPQLKDMLNDHRLLTKSFAIGALRHINVVGTNTFNGVTYEGGATVGAVADAINDRWHSAMFADAVDEGATATLILPPNYKAGSDIELEFAWTTTSSTSGNGYWDLGLAQKSSGGVYIDASDSETEYMGQTAIAGPTATNEIIRSSNVFSGAGLVAGDILSLILLREGGHANDTLSSNALVLATYCKIQIEKR